MKRSELKKMLEKADIDQLEKAFMLLYGELSEKQKTALDARLTALFEDEKKNGGSLLKERIETFCQKANEGAYARTDWLPDAKAIYYGLYGPHADEAVEVFLVFFRTLSSGLAYPLFMNAPDPFAALHTSQAELFEEAAVRVLDAGKTKAHMNTLLDLYCTVKTKEEEAFVYFAEPIVRALKTASARELMREQIDEALEEKESGPLLFLHLLLDDALDETETGLEWFDETHFPDLLYELSLCGQYRLWCRAYEYGTSVLRLSFNEYVQASYERYKTI